jgi:RNA polymerase sigma factor (TIGR02999 family)
MATADMTELLLRAARGDKQAEADLIARVYRELHRIARAYLRNERPDHTLQATALVHEAYLKLVAQREIDWKNRAHFFGIASQTMRRILVDYARQRNAEKRGGGGTNLSLDEGLVISDDQCDLVAELDTALLKLGELNERQAKIVELRFFSGLTEEEIAKVLGVSSRTVKRDWTTARAWLYGELSR